ncbi:MAG: family 78 glycoside hydrolase catalytic domain [Pirellulales bacterium]|nr:family 78 glycoside hydrolase catalytic domain [Pirellulales bacterium]
MIRSLSLCILAITPLAVSVAVGGENSSALTVTETFCEYATNPLGVETQKPRFGWHLKSDKRGQMQSACQILVAGSLEKLDAGIGDKWDSGKLSTEQSVNVDYQGSPPVSGERCYWKVRCWDRDNEVSSWSRPAWFEMGLLKRDDWKGEWIGMTSLHKPGQAPAPLLRKKFGIDKPIKRARAYVSGIGWSELFINGRKVGDRVLDPAISEYSKRVHYVTHDITDRLMQGTNVVGVMLGNGWYSNHKHFTEFGKWADSPRLLLQINVEFADGSRMSIMSDKNWKVSTGPILRNDIYGGEVYDARLEKPGWTTAADDDSGWGSVVIKDPPCAKLQSQLMPAIKAIQTIKPVKLTNPKPGVYVYDLGQVFGGWAKLRMKGPAGAKVTIKYSERILKDTGLLDERIFCYPGLKSTDEYILKGDPQGETYSPTFAFHPVRYVQIEGYPGTPALDGLEGTVVRTAEDFSGDFQCSNELFNQIHRNVVWTLGNALYGMPMDCLYREPISYIYVSGVYSILNTRKHMPLFWTKWLRDVADTQDEKGSISAIAPCYSISQFDTAFGGIYPVLVWYCHQLFGDIRILEEHYTGMKKWTDYLVSLAPDHLMTKGTYGDHMLPGKKPGKEEYIAKETPPPLIWTAYYYFDVSVMAQAAGVLGKTGDARHYAELAKKIKEAFNGKWFDRKLNRYAAGTQTSNLVALAIGLVPEANKDGVVNNVVKDIVEKYNGRFHAGDIGVACMIDTLPEHGQGELLYKLASSTKYPGWGYMVQEGAKTIWESWGRHWPGNPRERHESMIMLAFIEKFFYQDLAGVRAPAFHATRYMQPGYRQIIIRPQVLGDLTSAGASIKTVRGMVSSRWQRTGNSIKLDVVVPVNSEAKISVPKLGLQNVVVEEGNRTVWRNGSYMTGVPGITSGSDSVDNVTFTTGSGTYHFVLRSE